MPHFMKLWPKSASRIPLINIAELHSITETKDQQYRPEYPSNIIPQSEPFVKNESQRAEVLI